MSNLLNLRLNYLVSTLLAKNFCLVDQTLRSDILTELGPNLIKGRRRKGTRKRYLEKKNICE